MFLVVSLASPIALAQPQPPASKPAISPARLPRGTTQRAAELYYEADQAMQARRFADAAGLYRAAYEDCGVPDYLFLAGRAHHKAGDRKSAETAYRSFLAIPLPEDDRPRFQQLVALTRGYLEDLATERAAEAPQVNASARGARTATPAGSPGDAGRDADPAPALTETATRRTADMRDNRAGARWPWVTGGAGVIIAGVGLGTMLSASRDRDRVRGALDTDGLVTELTQREAYELRRGADRKAALAAALGGLGTAVAAGSLVWLLHTRATGQARPIPRVWLTPSPSGLALEGRF